MRSAAEEQLHRKIAGRIKRTIYQHIAQQSNTGVDDVCCQVGAPGEPAMLFRIIFRGHMDASNQRTLRECLQGELKSSIATILNDISVSTFRIVCTKWAYRDDVLQAYHWVIQERV